MSERDWIFNNASASDSKMMDISATQSVMLTAQDILLINAEMLNSPPNQTVSGGFIMV